MASSLSDHDPEEVPRPARPRMDSLAPSLPARIIVKTKTSPGALSSLGASSRYRNSGNPWDEFREDGLKDRLAGASDSKSTAELSGHFNDRRIVALSGKKAARSHDAEPYSEPALNAKRFRNIFRTVSQEWRNSPSLARPVVRELNLSFMLLQRQLPGVFGHVLRGNPTMITPMLNSEIYTAVTPNYSVLEVQHPAIFLKKFSLDGRYFVGFSSDLHCVHIYKYQSVVATGVLFGDTRYGIFSSAFADSSQHVLQRDAWKALFRDRFRVKLIPDDQVTTTICRDFILFTTDSRFVLTATTGTCDLDDESGPEVHRTNESLPFCARAPLEDFNFYLLALDTGRVTDQLDFKADKIPVANGGVYLQQDTLYILSTQHQNIYSFTLTEDGKFVPQRIWGQYCFGEQGPGQAWWNDIYKDVVPAHEVFLSTMTQKFLMALFRMAHKESTAAKSSFALVEFHSKAMFYRRMKMWKFQLMESSPEEPRMLIKWAPEEVVSGKASDASHYPQYLTFFEAERCHFSAIFDHREERMLKIAEEYRDALHNAPAQHPEFRMEAFHSRAVYEKAKLTLMAKTNSTMQDTCVKLLSQLPIACQSFSPSPYVDMALFLYDTNQISPAMNLRTKGDDPIR
ncbi:hypothetical protein RvY_16128-2 [Ramazzottius varieornatus]|nr:hypothetical protein RvY_16128-2 [Ramazzottius varieornatus]